MCSALSYTVDLEKCYRMNFAWWRFLLSPIIRGLPSYFCSCQGTHQPAACIKGGSGRLTLMEFEAFCLGDNSSWQWQQRCLVEQQQICFIMGWDFHDFVKTMCVCIYVDINIHIHISYILHPFWDTHKFSPSWWSWTLGCDPPPPSAAAPPAAAAVPPPVTITPPGPPTTWLPPDTTSVPAFPLARQLQTSHCRVPHLWKISRNCWGMCWRHCEARSLSRASDHILGGSQENPFKKTYWSMSRQDRTAECPDWFLCQRQKAWVLEPKATTKNTQCVVSRTALSCLVMWWDSNIHQTKGPSNFWSYLQGHCAELASDVCPFSVAHEQDNGTLAHCTHHGSRFLPSQVACRKHSPAFLPSWRWHIVTNRTKSYFCLVDIGKTTDNLSITHLYIMDPYKLQEDLVPILRKTYHYLEDHEARPGSRCRTFPDFLWSWSVVGSFPVFPGP